MVGVVELFCICICDCTQEKGPFDAHNVLRFFMYGLRSAYSTQWYNPFLCKALHSRAIRQANGRVPTTGTEKFQ